MSISTALGSRYMSWRNLALSSSHVSILRATGMKGPESSQCATENILSNPYSGIQFAFDKRRRNLEKRKSRLLQYEADLKDGKKLSEQQVEARYCIGEVDTQLDFLKDISKVVQALQKEYVRTMKQRDDGMKKDLVELERKHLEDFIHFQNVIERFAKVENKSVFLNGTDNETKITKEECKLIETLSEAFGLKCGESKTLMDSKKCKDASMLAYGILIGNKEKVVNDFSGIQIRELLEKIANSEHMRPDAEKDQLVKEDEFVKPCESAMESEVEQPKKDPKVVFVHVANGSVENCAEGDINHAGDTEFGFEGGIDPKALIRDPPPPIPFPATVVSEDPANAISARNHNVWRTEAKPEVSSKRRSDGAQNGFINDVEQVGRARGDERQQMRQAKVIGAPCNNFGIGDMKGGDLGKIPVIGRGRGRGRRQERDSFDGPRNTRGVARGRGFGGLGARSGVSDFAPHGPGIRNGNNSNNSQVNGGFKGNVNGERARNGSGCNEPPQPARRLGFNFASDAF